MKETAELNSAHNVKNIIIKYMFVKTDSAAVIACKNIA